MTPIMFNDINVDYEKVAQCLVQLGFDWKVAKKVDVDAYVQVVTGTLDDPKITTPQLAFSIPKSNKCNNGTAVSEFAVLAGIYEGMKQTTEYISNKMAVVTISLIGKNKIMFLLCRP